MKKQEFFDLVESAEKTNGGKAKSFYIVVDKESSRSTHNVILKGADGYNIKTLVKSKTPETANANMNQFLRWLADYVSCSNKDEEKAEIKVDASAMNIPRFVQDEINEKAKKPKNYKIMSVEDLIGKKATLNTVKANGDCDALVETTTLETNPNIKTFVNVLTGGQFVKVRQGEGWSQPIKGDEKTVVEALKRFNPEDEGIKSLLESTQNNLTYMVNENQNLRERLEKAEEKTELLQGFVDYYKERCDFLRSQNKNLNDSLGLAIKQKNKYFNFIQNLGSDVIKKFKDMFYAK